MSTLPADNGAFLTRAEDRQKLLWAGRTVFDIVLGGDDTEGKLALLEQCAQLGDVTPMHIHRAEAEIFYVIEGGITAWAGGERHDLDAGGAVYLPAGQPHALGIRTTTARVLTVTSPAGFAEFVRAAGVPVTGDVPATWEFDIGRILAAAPAQDIEIVGPPPSLA